MSESYVTGGISSVISKGKKKKNKKQKSPASKLFEVEAVEPTENDSPVEATEEAVEADDVQESVKDENEVDEVEMEPEEESEDDGDGEEKVRTRPKKRPKDSKEKEERTVFVGNLPISTSKKDLLRFFSGCGKIESVRIRGVVPEKLSISKKVAAITKTIHEKVSSVFGYVVFKSDDAAKNALSKNASEIEGHTIRVDKAGKKKYADDMTVFVGNLPIDVTEEEVRKFFESVGQIDGVRVVRDQATGIGKGFGFVVFDSSDNVMIALEKNNEQLLGREVRVKRLEHKSRQRTFQRHDAAGGAGPPHFDRNRQTGGAKKFDKPNDRPFHGGKKFDKPRTKTKFTDESSKSEESKPEKKKKKHIFSGEKGEKIAQKVKAKKKLLKSKKGANARLKVAQVLSK